MGQVGSKDPKRAPGQPQDGPRTRTDTKPTPTGHPGTPQRRAICARQSVPKWSPQEVLKRSSRILWTQKGENIEQYKTRQDKKCDTWSGKNGTRQDKTGQKLTKNGSVERLKVLDGEKWVDRAVGWLWGGCGVRRVRKSEDPAKGGAHLVIRGRAALEYPSIPFLKYFL